MEHLKRKGRSEQKVVVTGERRMNWRFHTKAK
jgi:hypothetical protein